MKRRGQLTIFIIIGVVLLIVGAVAITYFNSATSDELGGEANFVLEEVSDDDAKILQEYVQMCLGKTLLQSLRLSGAQGGEIYTDKFRDYDYSNPTESDGVQIFPGGDLKIPYWFYMYGDNDCDKVEDGCHEVMNIPYLTGSGVSTIQSQIEKYIEEKISKCVEDNYVMQKDAFIYDVSEDPEVEVSFNDESVSAYLEQEMNVYDEDKVTTISKFRAQVPINFKKYYDDAILLAIILNETKLMSYGTLNLINTYSEMSSNSLPPKVGSNFDFVYTDFWILDRVKLMVKDILIHNIPFYTVNGTLNYHPAKVNSFFSSFYENFIIPSNDEFNDYNINFEYFGWAPYIKINDDRDTIIEAETANINFIPWFGINRIRTMYSISYPVVVSLYNPSDLDGNGFVFSFATEVNIRNNDIMNSSYEVFDYSEQESYQGDETYLCDFDMRTSKNVSFTVLNGANKKPEPDVSISFICGDESCVVGKTGSDGVFNSPLPVCLGGRIQLIKDDFETLYLKVSPNVDKEINLFDIQFEPYRYVNVSVVKKMIEKKVLVSGEDSSNGGCGGVPDWKFRGKTEGISEGEQYIINLKRVEVKDSVEERDDFKTVAFVNYGDSVQLKLLPGIYDYTIIGSSDKSVTIPPRECCESYRSWYGKKKKRCWKVPDEEIKLDKYSGMGAYVGKDYGNIQWNVEKSDLDNSNEVEFKVAYIDIPNVAKNDTVVEDLEYMSKIEEFSSTFRRILSPSFK